MTEIKNQSEYPSKLEFFREQGWRSYEDSAKVITFWEKKSRGQDYDITGKVKILPEIKFDKKVKLSKVIHMLKSKYFTKKGDIRKKYLDMPQYQMYTLGNLMNLCNQAYLEREEFVYLSWQEMKFLEE